MGIRMMPTLPQLMVDYFDSLLGQFLIKRELTTDLSILFEATFRKKGQVIDADLIVLGGHQVLGKIMGAIF